MFNKLVRIGRDAELRHTANGMAVIGLACVYDIGFGDKKKGQWIEATIWGKQAEGLAPYLLKGKQVVIYAKDVELETYKKGDGSEGAKLKCSVVDINLVSDGSGGQNQQRAPQQQQQAPRQQAPQQVPQAQQQQQQSQNTSNSPAYASNDSFDDDIPF